MEWIIAIALIIGILFFFGVTTTYGKKREKERRELMNALHDIQTTLESIRQELLELKDRR